MIPKEWLRPPHGTQVRVRRSHEDSPTARRSRFAPLAVLLPLFLLAAPSDAQTSATGETRGTVSGTVRDARSRLPVIEAVVEVIGEKARVRTDLDGAYRLELPPGSYELRILAPLYEGKRVQNVRVRAGEATRVDVLLPPAGEAGVDVVEVIGRADRAAASTQLQLRQEASTVTENISAQEIQNSPDSDAGEAVQRLPAVVLKDDRYVNVRGLNERYATARLDGSRLPSTDPERRVVPLDLFPAEFLESISLVKTFLPQLPGDFSGGLIDIALRPYPEQRTFSLALSSAVNTNATFQTFDTYRAAGPADYFGLGEHFRRLPDLVPATAREVNQDRQRAIEIARAFDNIWSVSRISAPPDLGLNFNAGSRWGRFGMSLTGLYKTEYKRQNLTTANVLFAGDRAEFADRFSSRVSTFEARLAGLFSAGYEISEQHQLTFRALYNRNASDQVRTSIGTEDSTGHDLAFTKFLYTVDQLSFGQLIGKHQLPWLRVEWRTAFGYTEQDQPDGRLQTRDLTEGNIFINNNYGGRRLFGSLEERVTDSSVDFEHEVPWKLPAWRSTRPIRFRFGPSYLYRTREQGLRQFIFDVKDAPQLQPLPTEEIFAPGNIDLDPSRRAVRFREESKPRDFFSAAEEVLAGYGSWELPLYESAEDRHQLDLTAGVRTEYWHLQEEFADASGKPSPLRRTTVDPLPALSLVYRPNREWNIRFAWSETLARPDLRDLSPTQYPEQGSLETKAGDPRLQSVSIRNYDLRAEWFFAPLELVSAGLFYKELDRPIEQVIFYEGANRVFKPRNGDSATVLGAELEGRARLSRAWQRLAPFSLIANVTWADSEASIRQDSGSVRKRPLQGQAPFIVNAALEYEHSRWGTWRLLYNTSGRKVEAAGPPDEDPITRRPLIPEVYAERRDQLDFAYSRTVDIASMPIKVKLSAENLLNDQFVFTQAGLTQKRFTTGTRFALSFGTTF